jgi:hypothetical protein
MKFFIIIFFSGMLMISCKPKSGTEEPITSLPANADTTAYEAEIMKIHDSIMPKMTDLNHLESQLREIRKAASQSDIGSAAIPEGIDDTIAALKASQAGMLDWMEYYSAMRSKLQKDVMLEFMKQELVKINEVKDNVNGTIEKATTWLAAHPSK